ncbi:MAG: DUF484 family protein [Deltaproteobacteria bacterium]|nr:DUF484 family protein [Candidatus Tharpella sp.]
MGKSPDCNLIEVYKTLLVAFGPQNWWPAEGPEEMIIGALLTQNTTWKNVEKALINLRHSQPFSFSAIAATPLAKIQAQIKPSGYFRQKSKRLKALAAAIIKAGGLSHLEQKSTPDLRAWLLALEGVGPETADSILLYAFNRPVFVIDAYTLRICERHQWLPAAAKYTEAQIFFTQELPNDHLIFNEFHALLVQIGKNFCRPRNPLCEKCPLKYLLESTLKPLKDAMSSDDKTPPQGTVLDAKQAIFDKLFKETQELREQNYELDQTIINFKKLAKEREAQHKRFEDLEESILKADDLNSLSNELQSKLAADFAIPLANISLIRKANNPAELEKLVGTNHTNGVTATITFLDEADYKRLFPDQCPLISPNPNPILLNLLKPLNNTLHNIASSVFVPLISRGRAIGTLNMASSDPEKFIVGTATDAVESLGRKLATVIENNLLTAQLQILIRTDQLTGLYNRRVLDETLPIEFARAQRYGHHLSLIMIDLDDFKLVNDLYGHAAGDMVLSETGTIIKNSLRRHDIGLRYGGDEFTIILPNTNHQQSLSVIDKITKITSAAKIQVDQNTHVPIKLSTGLATFPNDLITDAEELKKAADEELYQVKKEKKSNKSPAPEDK